MHKGTLVKLYPKWASGYRAPEIVALSSPRGSVGPGPSDAHMYAIDPVAKLEPYDPPVYVPPYRGEVLPPAMPDRRGDFDWIAVGTPQFQAAHLFGSARRALDVWHHYIGHTVRWWHEEAHPRLELVTLVQWANAQSGPGFLETGLKPNRYGEVQPFCLNFDIIAHEIGHAVLFSELGVPDLAALTGEFLAFHESFSDLTALVSAMHFESVIDRLLSQTDGNLYVLNLVSRIGPLSDLDQIRIADNEAVMSDYADLRLNDDGTWFDPTGAGRNAHHLAQPLTGAIFDILVDLYQDGLVARGVLPPHADARGWSRAEVEASFAMLHREAARNYARFTEAFRQSLEEAREFVGLCMAHVVETLAVDDLDFDGVAAHFVEGAARLGLSRSVPEMINTFQLRGIEPSRRAMRESDEREAWRRLDYASRLARVRRARPQHVGCDVCPPDRFHVARQLMPHLHRAEPGSTHPAI